MGRQKIQYILEADDNASIVIRRVGDETEKLGRKTRETARGVGESTTQMNDAWGNLKDGFDAMNALLGAGIVTGFGQLVSELNETGARANLLEASFSELAREVGGADLVLRDMRAATGGVIDNLQLMESANALMLTGIAKSSDDLANMTAGAIKLGGAMGQDAAASIANFNAAMLNMSYERLDTLGVSASNVRARVQELKETGMETGDAFQKAVLEQMEVSLQRLGRAADASSTAMSRVQTRFENLQTKLGQGLNQGLEAGAMLVEIGFVMVEHQAEVREIEQQTRAELETVATALGEIYAQRFVDEFGSTLSTSDVEALIAQFLIDQTQNIDEVMSGAVNTSLSDSLYAAMFSQNADQLNEIAHLMQYVATLERERTTEIERQNTAMAEQEASLAADTSALNRQVEIYREQQAIAARTAATQAAHMASLDRAADAYLRQLDTMHEQAILTEQIDEATGRSLVAWGDALNLARGAVTAYGGVEIASFEAAQNAERLAFETEQAYLQAKNLGLEDEQLDSFKQAADETREIADQLNEANRNLSEISLAEAFGQGVSDRMLADITGQISFGDEDLQAQFDRMAGLATGELTSSSVRFEEELLPLFNKIGEELGPEAALQAALRFNETFKAGLEAGLSSDAALDEAARAVGYKLGESGGEGFTVQFGDTVSGLALEHGLSEEQVMQMLGISDPRELVAGMIAEMQGELMTLAPEGKEAGTLGDEESPEFGMERLGLSESVPGLERLQEVAIEISEMEIDLSPEKIGLLSSSEEMAMIQGKLTDITSTTHVVKVRYELETVGSIPPGAGSATPVSGIMNIGDS